MSNEQAFPGYRRVQRMGYQTDDVEPVGGMTLRDYFAAKALSAGNFPVLVGDYDGMAKACYAMADAMFKVRGGVLSGSVPDNKLDRALAYIDELRQATHRLNSEKKIITAQRDELLDALRDMLRLDLDDRPGAVAIDKARAAIAKAEGAAQ